MTDIKAAFLEARRRRGGFSHEEERIREQQILEQKKLEDEKIKQDEEKRKETQESAEVSKKIYDIRSTHMFSFITLKENKLKTDIKLVENTTDDYMISALAADIKYVISEYHTKYDELSKILDNIEKEKGLSFKQKVEQGLPTKPSEMRDFVATILETFFDKAKRLTFNDVKHQEKITKYIRELYDTAEKLFALEHVDVSFYMDTSNDELLARSLSEQLNEYDFLPPIRRALHT